jgi:hypothetical protein
MVLSSTPQSLNPSYSAATVKRAEIALICSPFPISLFTSMRQTSVPLPEMTGMGGKEKGYSDRPLSENRVERELSWLTKVGLLRREVDGQGITDSFRLTPLGRQLVEKWEQRSGNLPKPTGGDWLKNTGNRLLSWSF